ncbi:unnamed protein product [Adineta steineri]|uniref:Uncharacterized protein n=1 Tax=Adineta steineri TaxID=433720 RepID=A0A815D4G8_9BILA|nr:unnamed protein product [Adineta steineri]CAF1598112.1 unnamed protein product [Adineta steineri]
MTQPAAGLILDPTKLPNTTTVPQTKELPKVLVDFKKYVDSKFCYYSEPAGNADLINVQKKVAYQCHMKILMEGRRLNWRETPHNWTNETVLGSTTLGRFFEDTTRGGGGMGDIWRDYSFALPSHDKKSKSSRHLPEGNYLTRCTNCRGKRILSCTHCGGDGRINNKTEYCYNCKGRGQLTCSSCKGLGGFLHSPTLVVKWHTRESTWYCQNSYLPKKKIRKGTRTQFWSTRIVPWSERSSVENAVQSVIENAPGIDLRLNIINHYNDKHLKPTRSKSIIMRRFQCTVERMDFEEIQYTMGDNYTNKRDSTKGTTFRFCQYPGPKGRSTIYENDYPLNCCGCFGPTLACYSCCCNIL